MYLDPDLMKYISLLFFIASTSGIAQFWNQLGANINGGLDPTQFATTIALSGNGMTVGEKITEQSGLIGEKIDISGLEVIEATKVVAYNHPGNQIATIVGLTTDNEDEGKQVAMQIAAMNPISVDESSVPQDVIDRELSVGRELAIQEGKPEEMADKIAQGRLKKFYKETTLLNQMFVRDNKKTVKQFLTDTNPDLTVTDFKRISLSI